MKKEWVSALEAAGFTHNEEANCYENSNACIKQTTDAETLTVGTIVDGERTWKEETYETIEAAIEATQVPA
jgi:hypothetical protein